MIEFDVVAQRLLTANAAGGEMADVLAAFLVEEGREETCFLVARAAQPVKVNHQPKHGGLHELRDGDQIVIADLVLRFEVARVVEAEFWTRRPSDPKPRCPAIGYRLLSPALYEIRFRVAGLHRSPTGEVTTAREHYAQIFCPPEYPVFSGPLVRMMTPGVRHVHPNICPMSGMVCYGLEPEHWAPSLGMDDLAMLIARMLRLEVFNLASVIDTAMESAHHVRGLAERGLTPLDNQSLIVKSMKESWV